MEVGVIDAVISLPLNVFYGAGVPACLLILRKQRPPERHDQVLLVYAARHYRELSAQNELRPQDVMRILVHYHAYGDPAKVPNLVTQHSSRIRRMIDLQQEDEVALIQAEYEPHVDKLASLDAELTRALERQGTAKTKTEEHSAQFAVAKLERQRERIAAKLAERDERFAEAQRRAEEDRQDVIKVGEELLALYAGPEELLKHARVVSLAEIEDNEFNLNIPRYVDTFEPETRLEVTDALRALVEAQSAASVADNELLRLLKSAGYAD